MTRPLCPAIARNNVRIAHRGVCHELPVEVRARGAVERRRSLRDVAVDDPEPREQEAHAALHQAATQGTLVNDGEEEVLDRPYERRARARYSPAVDFLEALRKSTMTAQCVARKVVSTLVDLLHKWDLRVKEAAQSEHTTDLRHRRLRPKHVLEYCSRDNDIEAAITKGQRMSIRESVNLGIGINIDGHNAHTDLAREFGALTPSAKQQYSRLGRSTQPSGYVA